MMKKRILACFLILAMMVGMVSPSIMKAVNAVDDNTTEEKSGNTPENFVKPKFEEGKINLNGYYVVAKDGQLTEYLEWSFPYKNPLQQDLFPDPGRPYRYVMWQSKRNSTGKYDSDGKEIFTSWNNWETRSPVDVDAKDGSVWVLNVAPDNIAGSRNLENWMNAPATDYDGSKTTIGRDVIKVRTVSLSSFNANPSQILKTNPTNNQVETKYQYSVIVFGTCDSNNGQDLNEASYQETAKFYQAGGGILFGHDTIRSDFGYFKRFASKEYLNMTLDPAAVTVGHSSGGNANVKVVDRGFLTSRPWNLEGRTLTIPNAHVLGQKVGGQFSNSSGLQPRVWMQFSNASGNVNSVPGSSVTPYTKELSSGYLETNNYYLMTNGRMAMIQTGHSNGAATVDEQMVIANTVIYLAQSTTTTTAKDATFIDEAAPSKPEGEIVSVTPASNLVNYRAQIELSGSKDFGTEYVYRIQALPQTTISDGSDYDEKWSNQSNDQNDKSQYRDIALSGLKGYYVSTVNTTSTPEAKPTINSSTKLLTASSAGDKVQYETGTLVPGTQYYVHAFAVDYAGNVSEDIVLPVSLSAKRATFHHNDGTDTINQTLLTFDNKVASIPNNPTREGYQFLGWYTNEDGTGEKITKDSVFDIDEVDIYAKWIKTWDVTLGQRGQGEVYFSSENNESTPFKEGSDITVQWKPAEGYRVKCVWIDGEMILSNTDNQLKISSIDKDHHVQVEFEKIADKEVQEHYKVETVLCGGGVNSTITPTVHLQKDDNRTNNYKVNWTVADGYTVKKIYIDGIDRTDLLDKDSIIFSKIDSDHKVEVILEKENSQSRECEVITELVGGPGKVTPSAQVKRGSNHTVEASISDTRNYELKSITVYNSLGNEVNTFTVDKNAKTVQLTNIQEDYKVVIRIGPKSQSGTVTIPESDLLRVDTSHTGEGTITESSIVKRDSNYNVSWKVADGWKVQNIIVDGYKVYTPEEIESLDVEDSHHLFENIQGNHKVHVNFVKLESEQSEDTYRVSTSVIGNAAVVITSGNNALEKGTDYPIQWEIPKGYVLVSVSVNGEKRSDLLNKSNFTIENIDKNYDVVLHVEKIQKPQPEVQKIVKNIHHEDKTVVGDELEYAIVVRNKQKYSTWEDIEIKDMLPPGLQFCYGSLELVNPDGKVEKLPDSVYDSHKHAIIYTIEKAEGEESYTLKFKLKVGTNALDSQNPEYANITNTVKVTGKDPEGNTVLPKDPDKPDEIPGESSAVPPGGKEVTGIDPKGHIEKTAVNKSDPKGQAQVGDRITYSIKAENKVKGSILENTCILDKIPKGLKVDTSTFELQYPDGMCQKISEKAYDEKTRQLGVYIGKLYGGDAYILTFDVIVESDAIGKDIGNVGQILGNKPSDKPSQPGDDTPGGNIPGDNNPSGSKPGENTQLTQPGDPYIPKTDEDGKPLLPDGSPSTIEVKTEDPVYPSKEDKPNKDGSGGILPGDAKPKLDKEAKNMTHPSGKTYIGDVIEYKVKLTNSTPGTLWRNAVIFDDLPENLILDMKSLTLTYPNGEVVKLDSSVYDKANRIIQVNIKELSGGETYTLKYKAAIKVEKKVEKNKAKDIVNKAKVTGENPDGTKSKLTPKAEAGIKFPIDGINNDNLGDNIKNPTKTGDNNPIFLYSYLFGISSIYLMFSIYKKKRRVKRI